MKNSSNVVGSLALILLSLLLFNCKKEKTIPIVTSAAVTDITEYTATSGGEIISDGGGAITTRGVCWSTSSNPTIANSKTIEDTGNNSFTSLINGLTRHSTYYLRAYGTNSAGTGYGDEVSFSTIGSKPGIIFNPNLTYGTMMDVEGNIYKTIKIGTQTWMAENLRTTKFLDGTSIPYVTDDALWSSLTSPNPCFCWYNNDIRYKYTYGGLYTWYTLNTGKLCPIGWHVPTDAEWTTLFNFLGGDNVAGDKLKESGTNHWENPNAGATNGSGFTALPVGLRVYEGGNPNGRLFIGISEEGIFWSANEYGQDKDAALSQMVVNGDSRMSLAFGLGVLHAWKFNGLSIRCLKD